MSEQAEMTRDRGQEPRNKNQKKQNQKDPKLSNQISASLFYPTAEPEQRLGIWFSSFEICWEFVFWFLDFHLSVAASLADAPL